MSPVEKNPSNDNLDNSKELENQVETQEKAIDATNRKRERSEEVEEKVGLPAKKSREASVEEEEESPRVNTADQSTNTEGEKVEDGKKDLDDTKTIDSKDETEPEKENNAPAEEPISESKEATSEDLSKEDSKSKPDNSDTSNEKPKSIFGAKFSGFSFGSATSGAASVFSSTDDKPASFESLLMSSSSALDTEESKESSTANNEIGQGITPKIDLQKVEVTTGEEDEDTLYQVRAKLFVLDAETKGWKERGIGSLKLNVRQKDKKCARLIMRTEGVLKAILNVVIFADMKCEMVSDKYVRIVALEEGQKIVQYTIKVGSKNSAEELCDAIEGVKSTLSAA